MNVSLITVGPTRNQSKRFRSLRTWRRFERCSATANSFRWLATSACTLRRSKWFYLYYLYWFYQDTVDTCQSTSVTWSVCGIAPILSICQTTMMMTTTIKHTVDGDPQTLALVTRLNASSFVGIIHASNIEMA